MKKLNFFQRIIWVIREFIAGFAFKVFLWAQGMTKEEYWKTIQAQENWYDKSQGTLETND